MKKAKVLISLFLVLITLVSTQSTARQLLCLIMESEDHSALKIDVRKTLKDNNISTLK